MRKSRIISGDLPAGALIAALVVIFYGRAIITGSTLAFDDIQRYFYPMRFLLYQMAHGEGLFFWNPYLFAGMPMAGNLQAGLFFPGNVLFYLLKTSTALLVHQIVMMALAALFVYVYLRDLGFSRASSFIASLIYPWSGTYLLHSFHLPMMDSFTLIPLVFCCGEKTIRTRRVFWAAATGATLALSFMAGAPQITALLVTVFIPYMLAGAWSQGKERAFAFLGLAGIAAVMAFLLSAVQLLPSLESAALMLRTSPLSPAALTAQSLGFSSLPLMVLPDLYGSPIHSTFAGRFHFWEECHYVGIVALLLGFLGLRTGRDRLYHYFLGLACFSLLVSLGEGNPLFPILMKVLPTLSFFRMPGRSMILFVMALCYFCAAGSESVLSPSSGKHGKWFPVISIVAVALTSCALFAQGARTTGLAAFAVTGGMLCILLMLRERFSLSRSMVTMTVSTLMVASLWSFGFTWSIDVPGDYYRDPVPAFRKVARKDIIERVRYFPRREFWDTVDMGMLYNVANMMAYDPSVTEDTIRYMQASQGVLKIEESLRNSYDIMMFSCQDNFLTALMAPVSGIDGALVDGAALYSVQPVKMSAPRAFWVPGYLIEPDRQIMLEKLARGIYDIRRYIYLEEPVSSLPPGESASESRGIVTIHAIKPDYVILEVRADVPGLLFLSDSWYPGWKAFVDGKEEKIYRANFLFRAVKVNSGDHIVEFRYRPLSLLSGGILTLFGTILLFIALVLHNLDVIRQHKQEGAGTTQAS